MTTEVQVTFDCADPGRLAGFWALALGYESDEPPDGFDSWDAFLASVGVPEEQWNTRSAISDPERRGPRLYFQQEVPEPKTAKNRVHLDLRAAPGLSGPDRMDALEARATELVAAGATRVTRFEPGTELSAGFLVMADPEGNEFCLD